MHSERMKKDNPMFDPVLRRLSVKNRIKRPTYLERLFISLFEREKLPIDYVGDGSFWVGSGERDSKGRFKRSKGKKMNPDFKVRGQKKLIEVYGPKLLKNRGKDYERRRKRHYAKYGYECLVLAVNSRKFNEEEILKKVKLFLHNGVKIVNIRPSRVRKVKAINLHCEPYNNFFVNGVLVHNCWEDGKDVDYIYIQGFEYVRRDSSVITRRVQREAFEQILRGSPEKLVEYLRDVVKDMRAGRYSLRDVAITKTLHKKFKDYKSNVDYLRGAEYANKYLGADIRTGDTVRMLYVKNVKGKPSTDVVCFLDESDLPPVTVDYEKMIDRTVKGKVEDLLELAGTSWVRVQGTKSLLEVF